MRIIEQLVYKITGDNSEFDRSIDKSETKVSKFGSVADKMLAGVTVAAIGMVVKKMGDMVMSSANALDRVDKLSQKIGLSRVAFQEWDYILGQSGASVEGLQMGIKTLSNAADEAKKGTALYAESFDRLGVSVVDVNGKMKDQETLFNEVFVALANVDNQTERTAIANKLLGRSATELAPAINTSKEEIEQLRKEAHNLGVVYSDEVVDAGVLLGDNIERLTKAFDGLKTKALAPIIGLAVTFTDKILGQTVAGDKLDISLNNLLTTSGKYQEALEKVAEGTSDVSDAMLSQLKAQRDLQLLELQKEYAKSAKGLDKYNKTIETSEKWITRYNKSMEDMAQGTGYTTTELNRMTEQERLTALALSKGVQVGDAYNTQLGARIEYEKKLIEASVNVGLAESNRKAFVDLLTQAYIDGDESVQLYLNSDQKLADEVEANTTVIIKNREEIKRRNKAIELARTAFKAYSDATQEDLERLINLNRANKDSAYSTELVRLATEKLNEILAEKAKLAETEAEKEEARAEIIDNANKAVLVSIEYSKALGDAFDLNAEKTSIYTGAIKALIDSGLDPADERIKELIDKMPALSDELDDLAGDVSKALTPLEKWNESLHDSAYLFGITGDKQAYYRSMIDSTQRALLEMRKEGIEPASEEYQKLTRMLDGFNEKLKESQKDANAWKSTTIEAISAVSSTFTALGSLMDATTEARLQELDKMLQAELKAQGVAEETEMESLQRRLVKAIETGDAELQAELEREIKRQGIREDFDEKKKQIQIEDAQRQKALAIFQAIIDTASAIIKAMPNPYLMSLAGATGAIQLATIQAQPLPSFDVGSLRIERDTQAIVHRNEMILPASLSEQARKEGITISPKGGQDIHLQVYMDSKPIIDTTVRGINSGQYGKIDARVVK